MDKIISGTTVTAATVLISAGGAAANIVTNGGFEAQGIGGVLDAEGWTQIEVSPGMSEAVSVRNDEAPDEGNWHLELAVNGADDGGPLAEAQFLTALFSVTPGDAYDIALSARRVGDLGVGTIAGYEVQWLDSDGSNGGGVKGSSGFFGIGPDLTDDYQVFGASGIVAAADSDAALVVLRVVGGAFDGSDATVYFDGVSLVPSPGCAALVGLLLGVRRRRG
jgi:hypothetical protein